MRGLDHIRGAAVAAGGFAVPDGNQFIGLLDHVQAGVHEGFGSGFHMGEPDHPPRFVHQPVVVGTVCHGQPVPVPLGGDDDDQPAARIQHGVGENALGAVGDAGEAD
jgi:hypothetical protein